MDGSPGTGEGIKDVEVTLTDRDGEVTTTTTDADGCRCYACLRGWQYGNDQYANDHRRGHHCHSPTQPVTIWKANVWPLLHAYARVLVGQSCEY